MSPKQFITSRTQSRSALGRFLVSYWYDKDYDPFELLVGDGPWDVFVDSGGFTAETMGVKIDAKDYARWLKRYAHKMHVYANLDTIGNAAESEATLGQLQGMGLAPLPVFHAFSDTSILRAMAMKYDYICFGGMVPYLKSSRSRDTSFKRWLDASWNIIKQAERAKGRRVRVHGFGTTTVDILVRYPWSSVDSSSWLEGKAYSGVLRLFDNGRWVGVRLGDRKAVMKHRDLLHRHWLVPSVVARRDRYHHDLICTGCAIAFQRLERWLLAKTGVHTSVYLAGDIRSVRSVSAGLAMRGRTIHDDLVL